MPSTASARFALLVALLVALHIGAANVFRIHDRDSRVIASGKNSLDPESEVTALLVGGSGVHYGLSARILSEETPYTFLNASLILEGNRWVNYLDFLAGLDMVDPEAVELVIYSSSDIYNYYETPEFNLVGGRRGVLLFDSESWLQRPFGGGLKTVRLADRTPVDPATGDMVFLDRVCEDIYHHARAKTKPPQETIEVIAGRARDLERLFPNAEVLVRPWPVSEHHGYPLEKLHDDLEAGLKREGVRMFRPPLPLYTMDWACDASIHPTAEGRDTLSRLEAEALRKTIADPG